ncbi:Protein FAM131C [Fukomys damarensis]|uniref:Protein FAM131C n=1 Tax=Fukomys damarensis TaxID=885580 RepID=A0A091CPL5_FUKDA|nr:Protein FAM131C [Fukomys damarensis]
MPQGTEPLTPGLPSPYSPAFAVDHVTGKDKQLDFCWDPWQRCLQTTNGYLSDSRACASNCSVAALATSSLVGVAEQFAITEATLSAWSSQDAEELRPEDSPRDPVPLQDLESSYLPDSLLSGPLPDDSLLAFSSAGLSPDGWPSPQEPPATLLAFSSPGLSPDGWPSPEEPPITAASLQHPSPEQQQRRRLPGGPGPEGQDPLQGSLPSVDSGSLSEDEVFYN